MKKKNLVLAGFIIAKFCLQYILVSPDYELHRDDFLHLDQANHLAWGYTSVPPVTSWISSVIYFLGGSVFWVRFFPALFGALTIFMVWKIIGALKGNLFALILGATGVLFSVLLRLNILYQPNSLEILSWTTFYYLLIQYIRLGNSKWLLLCAVVFAIGFLNKYNIVFLIAGLAPAMLLTEHRSFFTRKEFYASLLIASLLIFPNLVWQYTNHFPVFRHLKELANTQLVNVNRWNFLKEQLLFFIGALFVILAALYALLCYQPFRPYRFLFWALCFTLAIFTYLKAKGYYAIGLYPVYIAFGSVYLGNVLNSGWKKYLQPVALLIPLLLFIPIYNVAFPNKSPEYIASHSDSYKDLGLLRWEDGKDHSLPQDFADMLGWKELARKVDSIYLKLPNKDQTLILCDNYGQAGAINYYLRDTNIRAVSFNADYINWFDLSKRYVNLIRVKSGDEIDDEFRKTSPFFEQAFNGGSISNPLAREYGTTVCVFINANVNINERIRSEIEARKKE